MRTKQQAKKTTCRGRPLPEEVDILSPELRDLVNYELVHVKRWFEAHPQPSITIGSGVVLSGYQKFEFGLNFQLETIWIRHKSFTPKQTEHVASALVRLDMRVLAYKANIKSLADLEKVTTAVLRFRRDPDDEEREIRRALGLARPPGVPASSAGPGGPGGAAVEDAVEGGTSGANGAGSPATPAAGRRLRMSLGAQGAQDAPQGTPQGASQGAPQDAHQGAQDAQDAHQGAQDAQDAHQGAQDAHQGAPDAPGAPGAPDAKAKARMRQAKRVLSRTTEPEFEQRIFMAMRVAAEGRAQEASVRERMGFSSRPMRLRFAQPDDDIDDPDEVDSEGNPVPNQYDLDDDFVDDS